MASRVHRPDRGVDVDPDHLRRRAVLPQPHRLDPQAGRQRRGRRPPVQRRRGPSRGQGPRTPHPQAQDRSAVHRPDPRHRQPLGHRQPSTARPPTSAAAATRSSWPGSTRRPRRSSLLSVPRDTRVQVPGHTLPTKINSAFGRGPGRLGRGDPELPSASRSTTGSCSTSPASSRSSTPSAGSRWTSRRWSPTRTPASTSPRPAARRSTATPPWPSPGRVSSKYFDPKTGKYVFDNTYEYGRARRQQIMMKVIAAHTVKKSLSNPLTAKSVIDTFTSHDRLAIDNQVSSSELLNLVGDYAGFDAATMQSFTLPTFTKRSSSPASATRTSRSCSRTRTSRPSRPGTTPRWPPPRPAPRRPRPRPRAPASAADRRDDHHAPRPPRRPPPQPPPRRRPHPTTTAGATPTTTATASPNEPRSWDPAPAADRQFGHFVGFLREMPDADLGGRRYEGRGAMTREPCQELIDLREQDFPPPRTPDGCAECLNEAPRGCPCASAASVAMSGAATSPPAATRAPTTGRPSTR